MGLMRAVCLLSLIASCRAHSYLVCTKWLGGSDACANAMPYFERTTAPAIAPGTVMSYNFEDLNLGKPTNSSALCLASADTTRTTDGSSNSYVTSLNPIAVDVGASVTLAWPANNRVWLVTLSSC